ncbi:RNA-binding S4 domain-containing protein [Salibacteraceae bacterium]|jgi:ribosome-associated heat shock protein Hsp15|nr:RNA-binding S4 domain-containing protein [Salibacteraceae bacterium]MDB4105207.1 RNA-binding S4 domain-containing protein [Salibacteraceae bacterium]MDB9708989.1 RNA-binding S4 domain-containing protein [Salibacteraceae bacterium]HAQ70947.1 RNA-binding protein [Flavobacteriales bacterium]
MRIDKYLWSIRLFKTRSLATFSCNEEKVKLNEGFTKASKEIHAGDVIALKAPPVWRTFEILATPKSRVGAKLVPDYMIETTDEESLKEIEMIRLLNSENRTIGIVGRPTKRHRRNLDKFKDL